MVCGKELVIAVSLPQSVSKILDAASLELLSESCRRSLRKLAGQADSEEQIDDTILTWWSSRRPANTEATAASAFQLKHLLEMFSFLKMLILMGFHEKDSQRVF